MYVASQWTCILLGGLLERIEGLIRGGLYDFLKESILEIVGLFYGGGGGTCIVSEYIKCLLGNFVLFSESKNELSITMI
jgi:hypothetical protein